MILEEIFDFEENCCVSVLFTCVLDSNTKKQVNFFFFGHLFISFQHTKYKKKAV